jgi:NADP-dependent 3-hydroxy acid dehydrogenase YdfG
VRVAACAGAERFGETHLLCNNAGVTGAGGPMWQLDARDWQWALGVNLRGVVYGGRAFVPGVGRTRARNVLNVGRTRSVADSIVLLDKKSFRYHDG